MSPDHTILNREFSVSRQVQLDEVPVIAAAGFGTLINNRPDHEEKDQPTSDQLAATAKAAGLAYYHLPVSPSGVTSRDVERLEGILEECVKPVYAFCRTGNRSTLLFEKTSAVKEDKPLTFLEVMGSTLAAVIGVQSKVNKERDFTRGNVVQFVFAGLIFTVIFVGLMIAIVRMVLAG